jgi:hypothetical protein
MLGSGTSQIYEDITFVKAEDTKNKCYALSVSVEPEAGPQICLSYQLVCHSLTCK